MNRVKVWDHFDLVINEIDIKAEFLLSINFKDEIYCQEVNLERQKFIDKIEQLRKINLDQVKENEELSVFKKFCFFIDQSFFVNTQEVRKSLLGYLVVVDNCFLSQEKLDLFRKFLFFCVDKNVEYFWLTKYVDLFFMIENVFKIR